MKAITYVTTQVTDIAPCGNQVILITLSDPDRWELPAFQAGAHIVIYLANGMRRAYSLCSDPDNRYHYQIAVKCEKNSRGGSSWIHENLRPGAVVAVSLPRSTMTLQPGMQKHLLIAGGIGITPMLSMIYTLQRQGQDYELHYFYRGVAPLLSEVQQIADPDKIHLYPADDLVPGRQNLSDILPTFRPDISLYCCGPDRMMQAFNHSGAAWLPHQLQQEHFSGVAVDDEMFPPYLLELRRSAKTILVRAGQTPLQALLEADVYVDHSCEGGICGACSVRWCEGKPVHRDKVLTDSERQHQVMLCVAGCESDKLVLDL